MLLTPFPRCKPSPPSSTPGATTRRRLPKVSPKKIPPTDAIFDQVNRINQAAEAADDVLRLSMDAQATVQVGPCARGGKSRTLVAAVDHDFQPTTTLTPVGLLLPAFNELLVYGVTSKVTSDGLADRLVQWWEAVRARFPHMTTLVLNVDHGPENHSHRTQFMQQMVEFVQQYQVTMRLAYSPPYHSKDNPME